MNILISTYNLQNVSLLIAFISVFPEERENSRILASSYSCRSLRHMFNKVNPVLDKRDEAEVIDSIEPLVELLPGLFVSSKQSQKFDALLRENFVDFALCVNPQLFKLMEVSF